MAETEQKKAKVQPSNNRKRKIWLISQWVGIPFLTIAALAVGLVVGYVYIGKRPLEDVYEIETWRHLYDLVDRKSVV